MSVVNLSPAASVAAALQKEVPWLWAPNSLFVLAAGNNCAGGLNADGWLFASQNFYDKPYTRSPEIKFIKLRSASEQAH